MKWNRREWLRGAGISVASVLGLHGFLEAESVGIQKTVGIFRPQNFGARVDGATKDTAALQATIDAASKSGGGTVYLSAGKYLSGILHLRSNVSIWLDNGAVLLMSKDFSDFADLQVPAIAQSQGSTEETSALLYGRNLDRVSIAGEGVVDGATTRRGGPKAVYFENCRNVSIRGVMLRNAPDYNLSFLGCERVVIDGVSILNGYADGIDLDCCRGVRLSNCYVDTIDDAIALKASRFAGETTSTEDVTVTNCNLRTASLHFKCGTESYGDFRNITVTNCTFESGTRFRHGNPGIGLYTVDGGNISEVTISNITMRGVGTAFAVIVGNRDAWGAGRSPGKLADVRISNIVAHNAQFPSVCTGLPDFPITGLSLRDITISLDGTKVEPGKLAEIPETPRHYPEPTMFGELPSFGLYMRHVTQAMIDNLSITSVHHAEEVAIAVDDLDELALQITVRRKGNSMWLRNVRNSLIDVLAPASDPGIHYRVSGSRTDRIMFRIAGVKNAEAILIRDADLPPTAVQHL